MTATCKDSTIPNIVRTIGSEDAAHAYATPNNDPKCTAACGRDENDKDVSCRRTVKLDKCKSWKTIRKFPLESAHKETGRDIERWHKTSGHRTLPEGEISHAPDSSALETPYEG